MSCLLNFRRSFFLNLAKFYHSTHSILGERYYVTFVLSSQYRMLSVCHSLTLMHLVLAHSIVLFINIFAPRCGIGIWRPYCQKLRTLSDATLLTGHRMQLGCEKYDFLLIPCFYLGNDTR